MAQELQESQERVGGISGQHGEDEGEGRGPRKGGGGGARDKQSADTCVASGSGVLSVEKRRDQLGHNSLPHTPAQPLVEVDGALGRVRGEVGELLAKREVRLQG